jgi:hypothetical protein
MVFIEIRLASFQLPDIKSWVRYSKMAVFVLNATHVPLGELAPSVMRSSSADLMLDGTSDEQSAHRAACVHVARR